MVLWPYSPVRPAVPISRRSRYTGAVTIIDVNGLTKAFRTYKKQPGFVGAIRGLFYRKYELTVAVKEVSFSVAEGELVGFLGPNGAGKTTTLKMLAGLLYPTRGSARVLGYIPWERNDGYRRQFALLLGQKNQLWWDLPAFESLELNAKIYGIPASSFERTVAELTELLQVKDKLNVPVRELSLGERMKMELIAALLHQPKVLFLDEPTIGLDVVSQQTVREFLRNYNATRKTTILIFRRFAAVSSSSIVEQFFSTGSSVKYWTASPILKSSPFSATPPRLVRLVIWRSMANWSNRLPITSNSRSNATGSSRCARPCSMSCR